MEALDGNSIAGPLHALFAREMTTARGACGHCGAVAQIAELRVYTRAPGAVVRCARCGQVVIVLSRIGAHTRIDLEKFRLQDG